MRQRENRHIAIFLLTLFVLFFSANTLFVHVHDVGSVKVVHSHPYLPGNSHSHSCESLPAIAFANASLSTMEAAAVISSVAPVVVALSVFTDRILLFSSRDCNCRDLRGPPAVMGV